MKNKFIDPGTLHIMPEDFQKALTSKPAAFSAWKNITELARNEWICWVESAKHVETRERRIMRAQQELSDGKRRPCCWAGCSHRAKQRNK